MVRLEIGGPPNPAEGYQQLDPIYRWGQDLLPFGKGTVDEVYAAHVIEHIPWYQVQDALKEAYRILKVGGTIEIHTVDFQYLVDCYLKNEAGDDWKARGNNPDLNPMQWVASRIFSVGPDDNWHKGIFDLPYLTDHLRMAGFHDVESAGTPKGHDHGAINLGLKAVKV